MEGEIGLSVVGKVAELMIEPIQRELGYLFCFNSNIQELEAKLDELKATRNDVQAREDAAKRMRHTLGEAAMKWIENANGEIDKAETVLNDKAELQKGCFSIKWCPNICLRFSLGRKGKKSSLVLVELIQSGRQLPTAGHALPMPSINMRDYNGDARDFDSRNQIMEDIIEMLKDDETMVIGICGMGGIGKTTFAKQLLQKVHDSHKHLFEIQVFTTVSSSPNFNAIQQQVAEMLGSSSLLKDVSSEIERAQRLRNCFSNKKVVLLDDVWKEFDLKAFGFPLNKSDVVGCFCKIIYTSRNHGLWLGERNINKQEFSLEVLSLQESLNLFKRKVDLPDDDIEFHSKNEMERQIVDECKGLPLALEVVGGALVNKSVYEWKDMLFRLQRQQLHDDKIHNIVQASYDFLEDRDAQCLFLLCCLFQEDEEIPIRTLYRYAVGLQLFKGMKYLNCSHRVNALLDDLTRRNLLIKVKKYAVKMHDVVRDVGISIAKQENNGINYLVCDDVDELENVMSPLTKMISLLFRKKDLEFLDKMEFRDSKLELIRLDSSPIYQTNIKISRNLFKGTDSLKVLDIVNFHDNIISEFALLDKLKMLSLEGCSLDIMTDVSSIGHFKCLEILCLRKSPIKTLPNEISELTNLRLLDLTECKCFISNGVLLRLTNLQELYMWNSFDNWRLPKEDVKDGDNHAAGLEELNCLHKLWRLEFEVPNIEQVPRSVRLFSFSTLLEQFKIRIGGGEKDIGYKSGERQLWLENIKDNTSFLHELGFLIEKDITDLYLCADSGMWENIRTNKFLSLKDIELKQCGSLFPQSPSSFQTFEHGCCLQRIELYECNEMTHLCSTSISRNLTNLQTLVLQKCEKTEEVVKFCDDTEQLDKIEFNTLETLKLFDLHTLECFCKRVNKIHFQKLKTLELKGLKQIIFSAKLEIPCLEELSIESIPNIESLCNILPPSLQKLKIVSCDNFQYVDFSDSLVMEVICRLRSLTIKNCKMLKGVAGVTTGAEEQQRKLIEFPNLSTLKLEFLDELACFVINVNNLSENEEKSQSALFYHDDYQVSFPCLDILKISRLPKINYIVRRKSGQIRGHHDDIQPPILLLFPNLKTLMLEDLEELISFAAVINNKDNNCKNQIALFHSDDDEVSFSSLKWLTIKQLPKINYIIVVKNGQIGGYHGDIEGHGREIQPPILLFPNLDTLRLIALKKLLSFVGVVNNMDNNCKNENALFHPEDNEVWFPCLKELIIDGLRKINYIVGIRKEGEKPREGCLRHDKIFPVLRELWLKDLSNLIHMYEINPPGLGVLLFQNLTQLEVDGCGKLRYLFSENIGRVAAKNIEWLEISNCGMMEVVMKKEDELIIEDDKAGESNSVENNNFFPRLRILYLLYLSGLRSFSDVTYTWALPSLYFIYVSYCPKLEAFSPGYLDSPRLYTLQYNDGEEVEVKVNVKNTWKGDVNGAFRHLFIIKRQKKEAQSVERETRELG